MRIKKLTGSELYNKYLSGGIVFTEIADRLDKRYQRADWRLRPLPADMVAYARLDTRYLLPLYCRLVKLLQEAGGSKLQEAWQASQQVALLRFEKPVLFGIAFSRKVEALKEKKYTAQQVRSLTDPWTS